MMSDVVIEHNVESFACILFDAVWVKRVGQRLTLTQPIRHPRCDGGGKQSETFACRSDGADR